jgi:hypothetical protein
MAGCALCGVAVETDPYLLRLGPGTQRTVVQLCHPCSGMPDGACVGCGQPAHASCTWVDFLASGACCGQPVCEYCWEATRFLNGTWALWCPQHAPGSVSKEKPPEA